MSAAIYKLQHFLYFRDDILIKLLIENGFFFVFLPPLFDKQPACCQFIIYQTTGLGTSCDVTISQYMKENSLRCYFIFFQLHTHV